MKDKLKKTLLLTAIATAQTLAHNADPMSQKLAKEVITWTLPAKPTKKKKKNRNAFGFKP